MSSIIRAAPPVAPVDLTFHASWEPPLVHRAHWTDRRDW